MTTLRNDPHGPMGTYDTSPVKAPPSGGRPLPDVTIRAEGQPLPWVVRCCGTPSPALMAQRPRGSQGAFDVTVYCDSCDSDLGVIEVGEPVTS